MKSHIFFTGFLGTVLLFCPILKSGAQESTSKTSMIYPTFGIGIGFFYPKDVNRYVEDWIVSGYYATNYEIYEYFEIKGGLALRLPKFEGGVNLEYDVAPKIGIGTDLSYSYSRVGPEVFANYFIGNKSGKNAFFVGGGINYSFLWFKEFKASAPGIKVQAGYSLQFKKFNLQPYGAFRFTKATDPTEFHVAEVLQFDGFDLTWTGFQIGVTLSVHERMLYR